MTKCSECEQEIPADDWGYGPDEDMHVDTHRTSYDEQEQYLCGPRVTDSKEAGQG